MYFSAGVPLHARVLKSFSLSFCLQVNSDVVFYSRQRDGTMQPVKLNQTHVGRMVLTKTPGAMTRRDITDQYKFPEGQ